MERPRSGQIGVILAALLLAAIVGGGWKVIVADLQAKSDTIALAKKASPASILLLNLDRDAYQAQLSLERLVQLEEAGIDAGHERDLHSKNVAQLVGERWAGFRSIGRTLSAVLPGEAQRVASFEADRDRWLATAATVTSSDPGPGRNTYLEQSKVEFGKMRRHLDIWEEDFYEPLTDSLGVSAVHSISMATITGIAVLSTAAVMTIGLTGMSISMLRKQEGSHRDREAELLETSRRQQFETQLRRALEMASSEDAAIQVVSRAVAQEVCHVGNAALLVTDPSRSHLEIAYQTGSSPGCAISYPGGCRALTTGGLQLFDDSTHLDSCPHLTAVASGCLTAVCAPLNIGGQATAVIHISRSCVEPFNGRELAAVSTIADHGGIRLSVIHNNTVISKQARTDPLTNLDNRRFFESDVAIMSDDCGSGTTLLMIDLDDFKILNDNHGHDTGDRALYEAKESGRNCVALAHD